MAHFKTSNMYIYILVSWLHVRNEIQTIIVEMSCILPLGYPAWISTRDIFDGLNPLGNISTMRPGWYTSSKPSVCELMGLVNPAGWWFQHQTYLYQVESSRPEFPNINSFSHQQSVIIPIKRFNYLKRLVRSGNLYKVHPFRILI